MGYSPRGHKELDMTERLTHSLTHSLGDNEGQRHLVCCRPWGDRVGHDLAAEQQQRMINER